ncbi:ABC transporter permease [Intestinimonas massiliensis]|uniref:ABC transporter permease n=1 Tax=Intestinimonas massiliensis (ex Afouda et al. 2020) TaxID=1673721 RepID=A0ABS9M5M0_9FIRM|nr:ABC transporter permease [Intestinimonas massiliensis (ex Afouda et al. 2020)]MCG4526087.1 ABC transporter permease [Intestinimonas massiliensis (ex Afouda et al. 2020)]MCQ4806469.1 ABC transporter permease [Intestinimonas massiliensis (ex Afouda et al. 2020)]
MKYVAEKFLTLIITLFIVSLLAFLAFQVIPGDPTTKMLGTEATQEAVAALRAELGLDKPVPVRYWNWLTAFLTGDMGTSYSYHMPVGEMLSEKLTITAILTILSFAFTVILSIPLGILAGSVRSKSLDWLITAFDQVVMSIPSFFIGILACFLFGIVFRLFTPGNFVSYTQDWGACIAYLLFPALSIAIPRIAMTVKMLRGAILNELGQDYVRTAQSRGNSRRAILQRHVLQNALIPVITFLAVSAAEIMTGSIIIEQVFTIPGVGRLLLASISNRDFPVVQAIVVILAAWIVVVNFVADLLYQLVDPRIRLR